MTGITGRISMHTLDLLQIALDTARQQGYQIRREWLGGIAAGSCRIAGKKILFVDVSLSILEQLEQVASSLASDPEILLSETAEPLARVLQSCREAKPASSPTDSLLSKRLIANSR
ncbi:MAG: hypothetical protein RLY14_833 [Planctomycetota bacterium]|jgi:hypothetical protein